MALLTRRSMIRLGAGTAGCGASLLGIGHPYATPLISWPQPGPTEVLAVDRSQGVLVALDRDLIPVQIFLLSAPVLVAGAGPGFFWAVHGGEAWAGGTFCLLGVNLDFASRTSRWELAGLPCALHVDGAHRAWLVGGSPGRRTLACFQAGHEQPRDYLLPPETEECWLRGGRVFFLRGEHLGWARLETLGARQAIAAEGSFSLHGLRLVDFDAHAQGVLLLGDSFADQNGDKSVRVVQRRLWGRPASSSQRVGAKGERILLRGGKSSPLETSEAWLIHARSRLVELLGSPGKRTHRLATGAAGGIAGIRDHRGSLLLATPTSLRCFGWDGRLLSSQGGFDQLVGLGGWHRVSGKPAHRGPRLRNS